MRDRTTADHRNVKERPARAWPGSATSDLGTHRSGKGSAIPKWNPEKAGLLPQVDLGRTRLLSHKMLVCNDFRDRDDSRHRLCLDRGVESVSELDADDLSYGRMSMRRFVALATMALVVSAVGSSHALDATRVIYDLSELQGSGLEAPASGGGSSTSSSTLPIGSLPISTPSQDSRLSEGLQLQSGDDLELVPKNGHVGRRSDPGSQAPRGGNGDSNGNQNPTPNPEPGTLVLLGGALASGARYVRRRRNA